MRFRGAGRSFSRNLIQYSRWAWEGELQDLQVFQNPLVAFLSVRWTADGAETIIVGSQVSVDVQDIPQSGLDEIIVSFT